MLPKIYLIYSMWHQNWHWPKNMLLLKDYGLVFHILFPPIIGWLTVMCQPEVVEGTQGEISCELPVIYIGNWYFTWNFPPTNFACFQLIFVGGKFHVKCKFTWIFPNKKTWKMLNSLENIEKRGKLMWNASTHGFSPIWKTNISDTSKI